LPLTDDYPQRLLPALAKRLMPDAVKGGDPAFTRFFRDVIDPGRAGVLFRRSPVIQRLWPGTLADRTIPFFDRQRVINRVMSEGADPLGHIEELHALLNETSLHRLALWSLGSNDTMERIAATAALPDDTSGMVEYQRGLAALTARNYRLASAYLIQADGRGLQLPTLRPLIAYAFCQSGRTDEARQLAEQASMATASERHFWTWLTSTFHLLRAVQ
jgi:hypothetical protein